VWPKALHPRSGLFARIQLGIIVCSFIAAAFSAYVLLLHLFRGSAPFRANQTTLLQVLLSYALWAVFGGAVFGLSLPLARNRWGAALVGFLCLIPFYGVIAFTEAGFAWTTRETAEVLAVSLLVGVPVGLSYYSMFGG
jgi:hypothetical protein